MAEPAGVLQQEVASTLRRLTWELDHTAQRFRNRFAEQHGLGRTDVRALVVVMEAARAGRPTTPGTLGSEVELSSASVTALIDRLERSGHVRRVRDEADRRRVVLELSPATLAAGADFFGGLQRDLEATMSHFTGEELTLVKRFLLEMTDVVADYQEPDTLSPSR